MKKITRKMFIDWHGGQDIWTQHEDLIEYFLSILNGELDIEKSRKEIIGVTRCLTVMGLENMELFYNEED